MLFESVIAVALAGAATAVTPPGFQPSSNADLIVAFGNTLALNGKMMTKAETANVPIVGTTKQLSGSYTIMMVDPDIPPPSVGGPTSELLHWMQSGFTSAKESTLIGGMQVFELVNLSNETAFAPYFGPSPPNKAPNTHRYTQLLLNTTGNAAALASLKMAGMTRSNFSAVNVVKAAGLTLLEGNSFNVSNGTASAIAPSGTMPNPAAANGTAVAAPPPMAPINTATLIQSNITKTTAKPAAPGAAQSTGGAVPAANSNGTTNSTGSVPITGTSGSVAGYNGQGAYVAGLLALAAACVML